VSQPYVGEIRMFGGNFAPAGWVFCAGQTLPISENETLFNLIGTTFGGDGQENFGIPDLRGRVPLHMGTGKDGINYQLAQQGGVETVTLTTQQMPIHNHTLIGTINQASATDPTNNLSAKPDKNLYRPEPASVAAMAPCIGPAGGNQPHDNMQPYLAINYIMSLFGIYPSQN
jgi:microcystin-dependent protein